jgi:hypothetical protein
VPPKLEYLPEECRAALPRPLIDPPPRTWIVNEAVTVSPTSKRTLAVPGSVPETDPTSERIEP